MRRTLLVCMLAAIAAAMLAQMPKPSGGVSGSSGGCGFTYGAYSALPGTCSTCSAYRTSNSVYDFVCTATNTWTAFFQGRFAKVPPSSGWTGDNCSGCTFSASLGFVQAVFPAASAVNARGYYRTAPSAPYTAKFLFRVDRSGASSGNGTEAGIMATFRDSAGKLVSLRTGHVAAGYGMVFDKWTSTTSFSAAYTSYTASNNTVDLQRTEIWMAVSDDNTDLKVYWSLEGSVWYQFGSSQSRTNFMASGPSQVGFFAYANGSDVRVSVISYEETASGTP